MPIKKAIFNKKNILVVGGAGFIGSHLCDSLLKDNKVICLDNFITGNEGNIEHLLQHPDFEFIKQDITTELNLEALPELKEFQIEFQGLQEIYFLASPTSPKDYAKYPIETMLANSVGLRNCLDLAVRHKAQFFYASASSVYGDGNKGKLLKEDYIGLVNQSGPRACFTESKRFGETLVENYRLKYGLDTKTVRIFNCYGPKMRLGDGRMMPEIIKAAMNNQDITIYGDEKSFGSYFYILDLIKGIKKVMESTENGPINLASEWKNKFSEIAQIVIKLTNSKSKIIYAKGDPLTGEQNLADITLAKEKLGWFPIVLLEDGIRQTIDYLEAQQGIRSPEELS